MDTEPVVANIMTVDVLVVQTTTNVSDAARMMVEGNVSGLPVVENGQLVGIVTEADMIARQMEVDPPAYGTFLDAIFRLPWDHSDEEIRHVLATTVGELMTEDAVTISSDAPISELASLMYKRHVNPVPVVDTQGHLIGIVSRSDIIRMLVRGDAASNADATP